MDSDDPAPVDISLAFFACVVVLFVFVVLATIRPPPPVELPTTGQPRPSVDAVPPTWSPIPERTTFALLQGDELVVLDLGHFAESIASPLNRINADQHYESVTLDRRQASPNAFLLRIQTAATDLPPEWVRARLPLRAAMDLPAAEAGVPAGASKQSGANSACIAVSGDDSPVLRSLLTVFVVARPGNDLEKFTTFAAECGLRYRIIPLPDARDGKLISIPIGLSSRQFTLTTMFR